MAKHKSLKQVLRETSQYYDELKTQTDRGAAIVACAYLDQNLADAIAARLTRARIIEKWDGRTIKDWLFEINGPFSSFSAKINASFAMGIITDESFRDLRALRKIRNDFAHVSYRITFETPAIKSRCSQLRSTAEDATTPRVQFLSAARRITGEVLEAALESRLSLAP